MTLHDDSPLRQPNRTRIEGELLDRLSSVMDPAYVETWLHEPLDALGGEPPMALIERGDSNAVMRVISRLENDTFA
jgi:hypothetical protein